jgi:ankyrin repeat protein
MVTDNIIHNCKYCYREKLAYRLYSTFLVPRLYKLAGTKKYHKIIARLKHKHIRKEAFFCHRYAPNDTVLHRLLSSSADDTSDQAIQMKAIQALLEANGQLAVTQDAFLRTPLHIAIRALNNDAASFLIQECPASLLVEDVQGRTPLHMLLLQDAIDDELLRRIVQTSSAAVGLLDIEKETPLDICARRKDEIANYEQVNEVLRGVPETDRQRTTGKRLLDSQTRTSRAFCNSCGCY